MRQNGPLVAEITPRKSLYDLVLPPHVESVICSLIEEQNRSELLRSHGLEPRHRVLLTGPPGNGKTSLAEAVANTLYVPFLVVRYEALIGSYLGETAQRVGQLFDYVRSRECVLFFDEFDVVGKERGDAHETGEIKRVVSSLLLQIDALPSYVIVITASNHPELLDRAVWRRFQLRLELPMPRAEEIEEWLQRFQLNSGHDLGVSLQKLSHELESASFAEVEEFAMNVLRRAVLDGPDTNRRKILQDCLVAWKQMARRNAKQKI